MRELFINFSIFPFFSLLSIFNSCLVPQLYTAEVCLVVFSTTEHTYLCGSNHIFAFGTVACVSIILTLCDVAVKLCPRYAHIGLVCRKEQEKEKVGKAEVCKEKYRSA